MGAEALVEPSRFPFPPFFGDDFRFFVTFFMAFAFRFLFLSFWDRVRNVIHSVSRTSVNYRKKKIQV